MGCFTAIILMSSCTTDSIEEIKKENSKNNNEISVSATTDIPPAETDATPGVDDKDKSHG